MIEQGSEVPYLSITTNGAAQVQFKKAVLGVRVTPQITPDNRILLKLQVNKDHVTRAKGTAGDTPIISTSQLKTQVLVKNNQTVVLGGIFMQEKREDNKQVPLLGDIPLLGLLFRNHSKLDHHTELLIFVTPKILHGRF